jgi:hypothetical protein
MESNAAEELASLERLQTSTRHEVVRAPRWVLPLMLVSAALFFLSYSFDIPGWAQVGWLVWVAYVWGVVIVARRHNRARASADLWRGFAVSLGVIAGGFVLAALTTPWVGGIAAGVVGASLGAFSARRAKVR